MWRRFWRGFMLGTLLAFPLALVLRVAVVTLGVADLAETLFERIAGLLPGGLLTAGIDALVAVLLWLDVGPTARMAKSVEHLLALFGWALATGVLGGLLAVACRRRSVGLAAAIALLGALVLATVALSPFEARSSTALAASVLVVVLGYQVWGAVLLLSLTPSPARAADAPQARVTRRQALLGSLAAALASSGALFLLARRRPAENALAGAPIDDLDGTSPAFAISSFEPAPGTRAELTSVEDFYRVDINLTPPKIEPLKWQLDVGGLVNAPSSLRFADLEHMPLVHQTVTLECISNPVGGDLISTAQMSGLRLRDLLERAGVGTSATAVRFTCADGYTESLPLSSALDERTILVVGMNGERLNAAHGFPLRLYTPDRFGMKNPKWLTRIDVVAEEPQGYWVKRGWSQRAQVKTTSVIDTQGRLSTAEDGAVALGGIAYAGARGISRVEVRIDDGPFEAATTKPPLSPLTWVLWRRDVTLAAGRHRVTVRAMDGSGALQTEKPSKPHPSGATGWHTVEIEV